MGSDYALSMGKILNSGILRFHEIMNNAKRGIVNGDKNYYLLFTAEAAKFDSFLPTVQKMINSFELSTPIDLQQEPGKLDNTLLYLSTAR